MSLCIYGTRLHLSEEHVVIDPEFDLDYQHRNLEVDVRIEG